MFHRSTLLAIPRGHPPPTQLPDEFSNYVQVFEIVDSHLPGYVYLELRYLLTEKDEDGKYNCSEIDNGGYLSFFLGKNVHGPAILTDNRHSPSVLSVDNVHCVRCLSWPPQAADWPTRYRNYDWPDSATIDHVVNDECDVVYVVHRQCKQHEWMRKHQQRLSFSRAEIVLINSWMPVQQIVYHMLRMFLKTKPLVDNTGNSERMAVSNYHIKTLMLWMSELKPRSWWTESLNLVRICVELLHTLSVCFTDTCCPHYFIMNCNLFDNSLSVGTLASELMSTDEAHLSTWFVYEYIGKCVKQCPDNVQRLFGDTITVDQLQNVVSAIVKFRLNTSLLGLSRAVCLGKYLLSYFISEWEPTVLSFFYLMNQLTKPDLGLYLSEYVSAVVLLKVAYTISRKGFNDNLMDVLATILGQFNERHRYSKQHSSVLSLNTAAKLIKVLAHKSISSPPVQLIEIELSKAYLHRALRCKDFDSESIYCLSNVYLAVLYYTTGQYQTAIEHCTLVTRSQDHSQCSSHVVEGELLPKIDDNIAHILGLIVFYQDVLSATLNQQKQRQYVSVFTTEIFAHYLHCRLLSVTQMSLPDIGHTYRYAKCISEIHQ